MIVKSKKDKNIEYIENTNLEKCDSEGKLQLYDYDIFGIPVIISIGKRNDEFIDNGIIYFPLYLIANNKFESKIGILEVNENCENNIYDEDGDIDLDCCSEPLFFNFVSCKYLNKIYNQIDNNDTNDLPNIETSRYMLDNPNDTWLNIFMNSDEYSIIDNEGNGDCLFIAIKDAYSGVNIDMTVFEMRTLLCENVTGEIFNSYKNLYESFVLSILGNINEMKTIKYKNEELKNKIKNMRNRSERKGILREGELCTEQFNYLKNQNKLSNTLLSEYEFMSSVNNITEFKNILLQNIFWGDIWAISILEKELNIKIVILSSENFENGDIDNILLCGQTSTNDEYKKPEYYVILDYNGCHYKLITFNGLTIFNFEYLPEGIKELICSKCLENMGGGYNYIPDFIDMMKNTKTLKIEKEIDNLYNTEENTVFMIHPRSAGNHAPGKGNGENIRINNIIKYTELENIKDWRRILSTYYESPFTLDGMRWNTIEHYLQGVKFKNTNPEYYKSFSLDSNTEYNKDPAIAKREITKKVLLCDPDYDFNKSLHNAYSQRAKEDNLFSKVLQLTLSAKIVYYLYRTPPMVMTELMCIRNIINKT
jgi:hypothetical protein